MSRTHLSPKLSWSASSKKYKSTFPKKVFTGDIFGIQMGDSGGLLRLPLKSDTSFPSNAKSNFDGLDLRGFLIDSYKTRKSPPSDPTAPNKITNFCTRRQY